MLHTALFRGEAAAAGGDMEALLSAMSTDSLMQGTQREVGPQVVVSDEADLRSAASVLCLGARVAPQVLAGSDAGDSSRVSSPCIATEIQRAFRLRALRKKFAVLCAEGGMEATPPADLFTRWRLGRKAAVPSGDPVFPHHEATHAPAAGEGGEGAAKGGAKPPARADAEGRDKERRHRREHRDTAFPADPGTVEELVGLGIIGSYSRAITQQLLRLSHADSRKLSLGADGAAESVTVAATREGDTMRLTLRHRAASVANTPMALPVARYHALRRLYAVHGPLAAQARAAGAPAGAFDVAAAEVALPMSVCVGRDSFDQRFHHDLWCSLRRHATARTHALCAQLPAACLPVLHQQFHVCAHAFSTPLAAYFPRYYSLHPGALWWVGWVVGEGVGRGGGCGGCGGR